MECKNCGNPISPNFKFCAMCGAQIDNGECPTSEPLPQNTPAQNTTLCTHKRLQYVSETVQLDVKGSSGALAFILTIAIFLWCICGCALLVCLASFFNRQLTVEILSAITLPTAFDLILKAIIFTCVYSIVKALMPYKQETRLRAVCLDCGETWIVKVIKK